MNTVYYNYKSRNSNYNIYLLKSTFLYIAIFMFIVTGSASGQFMNIQIDIDPEVDTVVEQTLDFGQVVTSSGQMDIKLGDSNMGIFKISALRAQRLLISLEHSSELRSVSSSNVATIPFDIQASYTDFGVNDYRQSIPLSSTIEEIFIEGPPANPNATWSSAYIYIYGSLDIGNIPGDVYVGKVQLTIVYE